MKSSKVLEYINNGEIETLRKLLEDEVFQESLKGNGNAKSRYAAMKRYYKYNQKCGNEKLMKPCKDVEITGAQVLHNVFIDGYSVVCTTESIGEIEAYNNEKNDFFDVGKMLTISTDATMERVNIEEVLAEAKAQGYKYKKSELGSSQDFTSYMHYKGGYYKIGILDQAYSIIADGNDAEVYYSSPKAPLYIMTSIGTCCVLPVSVPDVEKFTKSHIGIDVLSCKNVA